MPVGRQEGDGRRKRWCGPRGDMETRGARVEAGMGRCLAAGAASEKGGERSACASEVLNPGEGILLVVSGCMEIRH